MAIPLVIVLGIAVAGVFLVTGGKTKPGDGLHEVDLACAAVQSAAVERKAGRIAETQRLLNDAALHGRAAAALEERFQPFARSMEKIASHSVTTETVDSDLEPIGTYCRRSG